MLHHFKAPSEIDFHSYFTYPQSTLVLLMAIASAVAVLHDSF